MTTLPKFQQYAPILPLVVIFIGDLGRGVLNSLMFLYFIWGLSASIEFFIKTPGQRSAFFQENRVVIVIWLSLFTASLFSTFYNDALALGLKQWSVAFLASSVFIFTLLHVRNHRCLLDNKLLLSLFIFSLGLLTGKLLICYFDEHCIAASHVSAASIPMLAPFMFLIFYSKVERHSYLLISLLLVSVLALLMFADSRTEIIAYLLMLLFLFLFIYKKLWLILLSPVALLLVIFPYSNFFSLQELGISHDETQIFSGDVYRYLHATSTNRFDIWLNALNAPPSNAFLGAGINNTMAFLPENWHKSALHNAFLEIWYETGYLGLLLWTALFSLLVKNAFQVYRSAAENHRLVYAVFLSSFVCVIIVGMLDKGYMSFYFRFYIFYLGAMLYLLGKPQAFNFFRQKA